MKLKQNKFHVWSAIQEYVYSQYPEAETDWTYPKYGWNFRMKDKKRAILYFLPRNKFFKVALSSVKKLRILS